MSINEDLKSEIHSQSESLSDLSELQNQNALLQNEVDTLSNNTWASVYQEELEDLKIQLEEFSEKASKASELETEVKDLRHVKDKYSKTSKELKYEKSMNKTFISMLEQKHDSTANTNDYSFDPILMKSELDELKEINK